MFDIVIYRGVNTALISMGYFENCHVCATEATHIIGPHNPLVFAVHACIESFTVVLPLCSCVSIALLS